MGGKEEVKVHPAEKYMTKEDEESSGGSQLVTQANPLSSEDELSVKEEEEEEIEEVAAPQMPFWSETKRTINPTSHGMAQWDKTIMTVLLYTAIVTPFEVAFLTPEIGPMFVVNRLVDTVFIFDIAFTFYLDPGQDQNLKTNSQPDHHKIAMAYLKGWFFIDVVSCIPFDLASILMEGSSLEDLKFLRVTRLLRLIKLVRLLRATRMFDRWEDSMAINFAALSLTKSCCVVALFSHWFACLWYITYYIEEAEENWVTSGGFENYATFDSYIASWYFSVMTMSTIGYGDISPVTSAERIVACVMMLVGAGIYAYVVGSITSTVQTMEASTRKYQELMDQLNTFLEDNQVDNSLRVEARKYFRTRHQAGNLVDWRELLHEMSPDLREQIASQSHEDWCAGSNYFWDSPDDFRGKAAALFKEVTFPKAEKILEIGQNVDSIFVIKSGVVASAGKILTRGCLFGEDVVLNAIKSGDRRSPHAAMAFTFVQLQSLDVHELLELLEEFPAVKRSVQRATLRHLFKSHIYSYASAARELKGLKPIGVFPNRELIDHYKWKLEWLNPGTRGAPFFRSVLKVQSVWRGHLGRRRALTIKNSLLHQLNKTMFRSVAQINTTIETTSTGWFQKGGATLPALPKPQAAGPSAEFMQALVASLSQVTDRLAAVESQNGATMAAFQKHFESIEQKLGNSSRMPPPLPATGGPPPLPMVSTTVNLPMVGQPLPLKKES